MQQSGATKAMKTMKINHFIASPCSMVFSYIVGTKIIADAEKCFQELICQNIPKYISRERSGLELIIVSSNCQAFRAALPPKPWFNCSKKGDVPSEPTLRISEIACSQDFQCFNCTYAQHSQSMQRFQGNDARNFLSFAL